MSIYLTVGGIGGSHEDQIVDDIRALANKLGIMVETNFNGVMMMASPGESRDEVRDRFKRMQWADRIREKVRPANIRT